MIVFCLATGFAPNISLSCPSVRGLRYIGEPGVDCSAMICASSLAFCIGKPTVKDIGWEAGAGPRTLAFVRAVRGAPASCSNGACWSCGPDCTELGATNAVGAASPAGAGAPTPLPKTMNPPPSMMSVARIARRGARRGR